MKEKMFVLCVAVFLAQFVNAQIEMGLRAGVGTQDVNTSEITLNDLSGLRVNLADKSYSYHFGLYGQLKLSAFTLTPEVILNSNFYNYRIQEINEEGGIDRLIQDQVQYLDIPILLGLKLGPLRVYAGPEVHYFINSFSKLVEEEGFAEQVDKLSYGAIAGVGLNAGRLRLDVRYALNFAKFEEGITYDGDGVGFETDNSRLIFSVGYKLF